MAINKEKNVTIQVTFPKEDAEQLEALKEAFNKEDIKVSKSDILVKSFREYLKMIVAVGLINEKQEANKEEKKDA